MEFRFRAVDDRQPMYRSPASIASHFTDQALRGNPMVSAGLSTMDLRPNPEQMRNPNDFREAIQWELEKDRIREEILVAEIVRRRVIEAEVRRELMMEREMVMQKLTATAVGLSVEERLAMRLDSRLPLLHPLDCSVLRRLSSQFDMFPMPRLPDAMGFDIKPPSKINKDKLAKPNPNLSGAKWKAGTPFAWKKPEEEWSCALCQVSATNERGLNEHLQGKMHEAKEAELRSKKKHKVKEAGLGGKKHKAKAAGLGAQSMGKIASSTQPPEENTKATETADIGSSGLEARVAKESLRQNKTGGGSDQKMEMTGHLKNKNEHVPGQKTQTAKDSKKINGTLIEQRGEKITEIEKEGKFKFWCEMCQIGAHSQVVMETHKRGKKHMARLHNLCQKGCILTTSTKLSSGDTEKAINA
ncbi:hypothetical protein CJ030_MR5G023729 [Morella rubra]|uniref:U1-type domain-containing protein n=1 Tax=Morella rubra TaxID=262757 RepID=A0A6A1VH14_9ROSI|nr:hypothetical protein CJ030_MR5G023729 [Morella rubra]